MLWQHSNSGKVSLRMAPIKLDCNGCAMRVSTCRQNARWLVSVFEINGYLTTCDPYSMSLGVKNVETL